MKIEFEITLRCNAKCPSCSRHCPYGLYGPESDITIEQTERFVEECKQHGDIEIIHIMGGEPTLHPKLLQIVQLLCQVKTKLHIVTNGIIPVPEAVKALSVSITATDPAEKGPKHRCMFVAPIDTGQKLKDKCPVPLDCGISFGAYGYYPCGAGGAIARLFGFVDNRRQTIPVAFDNFVDVDKICKLCQARAEKYMFVKDFGDIKSVSFRNAFYDVGVSKRIENLKRY